MVAIYKYLAKNFDKNKHIIIQQTNNVPSIFLDHDKHPC